MIRKLLYRFRRMALEWRLSRLKNKFYRMRNCNISPAQLFYQINETRLQLAKLDATEMSKGEAHVVVR